MVARRTPVGTAGGPIICGDEPLDEAEVEDDVDDESDFAIERDWIRGCDIARSTVTGRRDGLVPSTAGDDIGNEGSCRDSRGTVGNGCDDEDEESEGEVTTEEMAYERRGASTLCRSRGFCASPSSSIDAVDCEGYDHDENVDIDAGWATAVTVVAGWSALSVEVGSKNGDR